MELPLFVWVNGTVIGLTYGLLALGLVLIYKSNRILNFAHGELGLISALFMEKLVNEHGAPYWPTLALVLVIAMLIGAGIELLLRRLFARPRLLVMVATIGLSQLLLMLSLFSFVRPEQGADRFPVPFDLQWTIGGIVLLPDQVFILVVAPLAALGVALFFRLTPYGLAIRAAAENADSARLGGIWVRRTSTVAWVIAALLSAVTAILVAPTRPNFVGIALGPGLLVRALAAALIGGMTNLRTAFLAGIGVGIVEQFVAWNWPVGGTIEAVMYGVLLVVLVARVGRLRVNERTEERSSWQLGGATRLRTLDVDRRRLGVVASLVSLGVLLVLPAMLRASQAFLFSRMFAFAIIALSLTLLTGWAGQLSLGQFGLVAVGIIVTTRWQQELPVPLLLVAAGTVTALVATMVGLPALRIRGLYLAVTTMGFAVIMADWLMKHPQLGLPDPFSTFVERPTLLGVDFRSEHTYYYFALAVLLLAVAATHRLRRSGVARAFIAVRDNETAAAAMGIRVVRTKLLAFAVSGFLAGMAGVVLAYAYQRVSAPGTVAAGSFGQGSFDAYQSIVVVSMVVIGGLGSIRGALLGAAYLFGIPAIFGFTPLIEVLTGGVGVTVFVLYLPGGLVALLDKLGDTLMRLKPAHTGAVPGNTSLTTPEVVT